MIDHHFGAWVRQQREARLANGDSAFSLRRFAAACSLSPTFQSRMETGQIEPPSGEKLAAMALLLGVDRWDFFRRAARPDPVLTEMVAKPPRWLADLLWISGVDAWTEKEAEMAKKVVAESRRQSAGPGPVKGGRGR